MIENEFRVWGPPGTGKTTYLSTQIASAVEKSGGESVLVASFTRAAAAELVSRGLPIPREQIGTLHAHCYHALQRPDLAEKFLKNWNEEYPQYALGGEGIDLDDADAPLVVSGEGDRLMQECQLYRSRMQPMHTWPSENARHFYSRWTDWKTVNHLFDFTDLIETVVRDGAAAPGNPTIGFFDECQDFSRLEIELVRTWGKHMDQVIIAADDDQSIYSFKGADPKLLFGDPIPDSHRRVLAQSYRVPRRVHAFAAGLTGALSWREPKEYRPRDVEGFVSVQEGWNFNRIEEAVDEATDWIKGGYRVMFLASCSYMLRPLIKVLREQGIPFGNSYRTNRREWNPLAPSKGTSSVDRLLAFLQPQPDVWGERSRLWTRRELLLWTEMVKKNALPKNSRALLELLPDNDDPVPAERLEFIFGETIEPVIEGDLSWLQENLLAARTKALEYAFTVADHRGAVELRERPRVVVGTIHSVKGGQADVVFLMPDLSPASYAEGGRTAGMDNLLRLFYVGATRARSGLFLMGGVNQVHQFNLTHRVDKIQAGRYRILREFAGAPTHKGEDSDRYRADSS